MDSAMSSAVSALQAQQSALSTVSNNLANSQTTGYKAVETQFNSLLTQQSTSVSFTSGGVQAVARQNLLQGGTITGTSTTTDMAISGNGLFAVSYGLPSTTAATGSAATTTTTSTQTLFTRNGAFDSDAKGNLYLSGTNYYLQGWPTDANGGVLAANSDNIASLQPVNIQKLNNSAVATTSYTLAANLPAEAQNQLANLGYTNANGTTENVSMSYALAGTTAATTAVDSTATYLVTFSAAPGTTITDGTNTGTELTYQMTVDTSPGATNGVVYDIQNATAGTGAVLLPVVAPATTVPPTAPPSATFPVITPSDEATASPVVYPTTWSGGGVNPTWSELSTTMSTNFSTQTSMSVYDSLGVEQTFPVTWTATGDNTWLMTVGTPTNPAGTKTTGNLTDTAGSVVSNYSYSVTFNSDGTLGSFTALPTISGTAPTTSSGGPELLATWADGAAPSTGTTGITLNLGTSGKTDGLSQFDTGQTTPAYSPKTTIQNGVQYGQLTGVSVDSSGNVIASYDNGHKVPIYKIPVVTFPNENGLTAKSDGVYEQSSLSGNYTLNQSGSNGAGNIEGGALESSTVNTSVEFSNMITAQQAYSSASQVISTDKQMFTSLLQVVQ